MASWLSPSGVAETKEEHWAAITTLTEDREAGAAARAELKTFPGADKLLAFERNAAWDNSHEEP